MKEYDFRMPALADLGSDDTLMKARVREVRALLLDLAGGFTELPMAACQDIIPGKGLGYIVALETGSQARLLQARLSALARNWASEPPTIVEAAHGPRKDYCFFLIPESANPDHNGQRRPLFAPSRWDALDTAIRGRLSRSPIFVYGEWRPQQSAHFHSTDVLRMYLVRWESEATAELLREFLQTYVFDGGKECDQFFLYLSIQGKNELVAERN